MEAPTQRRVGILGLARSGRAAALLALANGWDVFASDGGRASALDGVAQELRSAGAEVELGGHDAARLAACDVIVVSPGIPPTTPVLQDPALRAVPKISELEFAFRFLRAPVIAITGTNGKSTTTACIAHVLRTAGFNAPEAGNIGTALSEIALHEPRADWVVVEASSFQLADIETFAPRIGVLTNLSPDHLDRYPSVEAYYADKARMFENATHESTWVLNADDAEVMRMGAGAAGRHLLFSLNASLPDAADGAFLRAGALILRTAGSEQTVMRADSLPLLGMHNIANALAALLAAHAAGAPADAIARGLQSFGGLHHRLERVAERNGVLYINDSKATNVASTLVAIRSMTRPTVLLLGGRHKGEPYTGLADAIRAHVKSVVAYGEAAPIVQEDLKTVVDVQRVDTAFEDVVRRATKIAVPGDAVLLSPACSSFDMFRNYEERGNRFRELVCGHA